MNAIILPISIKPGFDDDILLDHVARFAISLQHPDIYGSMINEEIEYFIINTDMNLIYIFIRCLYIEEIYEDGTYVLIDVEKIVNFLNNYNQLTVPKSNATPIALAELDPNSFEQFNFKQGFMYKDVLQLFIDDNEKNEFIDMLTDYNIKIVENVNDILKT
jgi:hypothetical protein